MRVRGSAGAASLRRGESLERGLEAARAPVQALKQPREADPGAAPRRQQAARERAARERQERVEKARARLPEVAKLNVKQGQPPEVARPSTTAAEATVMKMADGGFRPAGNAQYATDTASQVIVGVAAVTRGRDLGPRVPMVEPVGERCGQYPAAWRVDGGYPAHEQLDQAAAHPVVYAPVPKPKRATTAPHLAKEQDSPAVGAWRQRMGTDEAKDLYQERAATAEGVNALARQRGLLRLRVRGTTKVRGVLLRYALAHNLMRTFALAPALLGRGVSTPSGIAMAT